MPFHYYDYSLLLLFAIGPCVLGYGVGCCWYINPGSSPWRALKAQQQAETKTRQCLGNKIAFCFLLPGQGQRQGRAGRHTGQVLPRRLPRGLGRPHPPPPVHQRQLSGRQHTGPNRDGGGGGGGKDDDLPDTVVAFDEGRGTMAAASQWLRIDAMLGCFDEVLEEIRQLKKAIKTMKQS